MQLIRRQFSDEAKGSFLNKSEVTDRVLCVVRNFQKVDPSKMLLKIFADVGKYTELKISGKMRSGEMMIIAWNQRAEPIIIDFLRLYLSKKSDISWTTQRCSLPTSFKLFTDLPDTNDDLIDSSDESDHEIAADNDDSVQKFMK
ncbi:acyl carrier protein 2 mitochondrial [Phtheirospermum japonicum]|uniref:Acyl carrier protein 2 mitochondrial n=1 Tax=Phtheirospermum japonicum TaxID=374723 RepID=A0A830C7B2_9LAMI|nr:acyl carrier protein 2 mitochondrial [Phtheirospermum japonicum]